jgi:hypothetical protein
VRPRTRPVLDARRAAELVAELYARRPGYLAPWRPVPRSAGDGLVRVWARYIEALL